MHQVIVDSIHRVDLDLRKSLFSNIVLSGGSTLCQGKCFPERRNGVAYLPRVWRSFTQRSEEISIEGRKDQNLCTARAQVLNVDRWEYPCGFKYLQKGYIFLHALVNIDSFAISRCGFPPKNTKKIRISFTKSLDFKLQISLLNIFTLYM